MFSQHIIHKNLSVMVVMNDPGGLCYGIHKVVSVSSWRGTPSSHPFLGGIFHELNQQFYGVSPWLWKPPWFHIIPYYPILSIVIPYHPSKNPIWSMIVPYYPIWFSAIIHHIWKPYGNQDRPDSPSVNWFQGTAKSTRNRTEIISSLVIPRTFGEPEVPMEGWNPSAFSL